MCIVLCIAEGFLGGFTDTGTQQSCFFLLAEDSRKLLGYSRVILHTALYGLLERLSMNECSCFCISVTVF